VKAEVKSSVKASPSVSLFIFRLDILLPIFDRRRGFGGHTIFFVSPATKVYQLAAFGTERAVRIILPFGGLPAVRTIHNAKCKIKNAKLKKLEPLVRFQFCIFNF
jgi:hypothetical protein